jgi:hypothetical protein
LPSFDRSARIARFSIEKSSRRNSHSGTNGSWKKNMYQLLRSCLTVFSPASIRAGCGTLRIASRRTDSGCSAATP